MRGNGRYQLVLGLALAASLAFLAFLLARPVGDDAVKLVANLAQLLAPVVAAAGCAAAAGSGTGRTRRAWALLAASAASWAVGQATWVWYEHLAQRELPFPSLADFGYLTAIPLAAAAMLAFPGRAERAVLQARSLLDGAVIATSLLYSSWALVLGPVFRASRPASGTRTRWPASAGTSSPTCSSRPPATRSPSASPAASWRRCALPSPSVAPRSRSEPASA